MIARRTQDLLNRFSQSFHRMKAFWVQMTDLDLFFRYLKGCSHGNQFCGKMAKFPSFVALAFRNGMGYRYLNVRINSSLYRVKISWTLGQWLQSLHSSFLTSGTTRQKLAYLVEYLWIYMYSTDSRNHFTIWKCFGSRWLIWTLFSDLSKDEGCCHGNQITLRDVGLMNADWYCVHCLH